ncbi:MAG: hypothetical protein IT486_10000 [Gammaproteobacteria bacterium]|nr:hypothetical protein [Gammaproteobacteria bacterium]
MNGGNQTCALTPGAWRDVAATCLLALVPGLAAAPAGAVSWEYAPYLAVGGLWESNPRSVSVSSWEDDAYAAILDTRLNIAGKTRIDTLTFNPRLVAASYGGATDASDLDYVDYHLPVGISRLGEVTRSQLDAGFSRTSTRSFPGVDPNQPPDPNTSRPKVDEFQERWWVSPSLLWQLAPRDILSADLSYDHVEFTKAELTRRTDYEAANIDVAWRHTLTPQHEVSLNLNVSAFESELPGTTIENDSVSYGGYLGYEYAWSESTTLGGTAGSSRSDVTVKGLPFLNTPIGPLPCFDPEQNRFVLCEVKTEDRNFVGEIYLRQNAAETITTEFRLSRSIQPNSDGAQVTVDSARAYVSKDFSRLVRGSLGVTYSQQEAVGADNIEGNFGRRFKRNYWSTVASLNWRMTRTWTVRTEYGFYRDERDEGIAAYDIPRHRVNLWLQYSGLPRR